MFKNYNYFYYDLFIRYSNLSIIQLKTIENLDIDICEVDDTFRDLLQKLPIFDNFHWDENNLLYKNIFLFIGLKKNIKNIFSFFGDGIKFFKAYETEEFIKQIDFFLSLTNYSLTDNYNVFLKNIYIFNIFKLNNNYLDIFIHALTDDNDLDIFYDTLFDLELEDIEEIDTDLIVNNDINSSQLNFINIKNRQIYHIKLKRYFYNLFYKYKNKKIKKNIKNIKNINIKNKIFAYEFTINELLKKSFLLSNLEIIWLWKNRFVFINNKICYNLNYILKKNDKIHLKVNSNIYILFRLNYSIKLKQYYKLLNYHNRYLEANNLVFNKQIFFNFINNFFDVFKFIEVDYIILTIFILYLPFNKIDYNFFNLYYKSVFNLNLLNWKILY